MIGRDHVSGSPNLTSHAQRWQQNNWNLCVSGCLTKTKPGQEPNRYNYRDDTKLPHLFLFYSMTCFNKQILYP